MVLRVRSHRRPALVVATEILFLLCVMVIAGIAGLVAFRQAVVSEFSETAGAIRSLDQSYRIPGNSLFGGRAFTAGSEAIDLNHRPPEAWDDWVWDSDVVITGRNNRFFVGNRCDMRVRMIPPFSRTIINDMDCIDRHNIPPGYYHIPALGGSVFVDDEPSAVKK